MTVSALELSTPRRRLLAIDDVFADDAAARDTVDLDGHTEAEMTVQLVEIYLQRKAAGSVDGLR